MDKETKENERAPDFFEELRAQHLKLWWAQKRQQEALRAAGRSRRITTATKFEGGKFK